MDILLFVFFLIVFILMLTGGSIIKAIKKAKKNAQEAADRKEQRFRDEVGRQRQQYSQRQQTQQAQSSYESQSHQSSQETIIDNRHQERENRKIFDDSDGEYVDFIEE